LDLIVTQMQETGLLSAEAAQRARAALAEGSPIEEAVLSADGVGEDRLLRFLAESFGLPFADLEKAPAPSKEFLAKFPARVLVRHHILPIEERADGVTIVATSRVSDTTGLDELRLVSGRDVALALAPSGEIDRLLREVLGVGADTLQSLDAATSGDIQVLDEDNETDLDADSAAQDASIIRFVNQVLTEAIESRATDVHVEPFEDQLRLRYRVDGILVQANVPPSVRRFHAAIVSRIKILSHLDIAEKRLPQDGRIKLKIAGREIDVRVSIIPMIHGEAVVLRILDRSDAILGIEHMGMADRDFKHFKKLLDMPHGIVLVTGPTGSGKTTTLYAALSKINDVQRKIVTIEDPVEYQLRGVNQIQVNAKSGLTFAMGLRSILRHDPDVVLVGEIRDTETANIAIQASLTGHLVFSTLHTNDAPGATTRLVEMGVEPYLVSSSVEAAIAQRLVRVICKHCKHELPEAEAQVLQAEFGGDVLPPVLYRGSGCRHCQGTGFRGRRGIFEMMPMSDDIRSLVLERSASHSIRKVAVRQGMRSLREDGWRLVREGVTTVDEVLQNTKDEAASVGDYAAEDAATRAGEAAAALTTAGRAE
jgi:general secretion pathway protein E/type IV pilus assembly protein PilB